VVKRILAGATGAVLAFSLVATPAFARDRHHGDHRGVKASEDSSTLSHQDNDFLKAASQGNIFEVVGGTMAAAQAVTPEGKALGLKLVSDHTIAEAGLVILTVMSDKQAAELEDVVSNTGLHFDDEYSELEVQDHIQDIKDFKTEVNEGRNADVRAFAAASLPMLEMHLAAAMAVNDVVEALPGHEGDAGEG
jgi:putative membrane protein